MSEGDAVDARRLETLKKAFNRVVEKREKKVITRLVNEYRNSELTADKAFAAIMVIAELRFAGSDVATEDLQ